MSEALKRSKWRKSRGHRAIAISLSCLSAALVPIATSLGVGASQAANFALVGGASPSGSGSAEAFGGGPALGTNLDQPSGIAVDPSGNLLIADTDDGTVDLIARSSTNPGYSLGGTWQPGNLYLLAGDASGVAPTPSGTVAALTLLNLPGDVSVDPQGNVLIAATGDNEIDVLAESSTTPPYDLGGATWRVGELYVLAGQSEGLNQPGAVVPFEIGGVSHGDLVVTNTAARQVDLLPAVAANPGLAMLGPTLTVGTLYPIAGGAGDTPADACGLLAEEPELNSPDGLAVDAEGNVVFADTGNDQVQLLATSTLNPGYVLGSHAVWQVGRDYVIAGSGAHADGSACSLPNATTLNAPTTLTLDPNGNPVIADSSNREIRVLAESVANPGYAISGSWTPGEAAVVAGGGATAVSVSGSIATSTLLAQPAGVAVAGNGVAFVADAGTSEISELQLTAGQVRSPAAAAGAEKVSLTWTSPSTNGGSVIAGYQVVEYVNGSSMPTTTIETGSVTPSVQVTGLTDGTSYGFTIAAENAIGTGAPSVEVSATPVSPPVVPPSTTPTTLAPSGDSIPSPAVDSGGGTTSGGGSSTAPVIVVVPASTSPAAKSTAKSRRSPSIRLNTPSAVAAANGVVLQVTCSGSCSGEAELSDTTTVGSGAHRILRTEVVAATPYRVSIVGTVRLRVPLTTVGRQLLVPLRRQFVVAETLTVKGGRTVSGRIRLLPPAPVATR